METIKVEAVKGVKKRLKAIRKFQKLYPEAVICGSFGLYLQGIKIGRTLKNSDIDILLVGNSFIRKSPFINLGNIPNSGSDFDISVSYNNIRIDIREYCPENPSSIGVTFKGKVYKVQPIYDILQKKLEYCEKNAPSSEKHKTDINNMLHKFKQKS